MPDTFSATERSRIMRAVKGYDTSLEMKVRSALWRLGLRYRKNLSSLPGKPDIVFSRKRLVVFIDSCFWHGCPDHLRRPKSNQTYWEEKIARNKRRDAEVTSIYSSMNWSIIRIWEHELKQNFEPCIRKIARKAKSLAR